MLGAVLVHPDCQEVFPLAPEPILKPDGATKNDCERNAAKRLLTALRREHPHPHLKLIVIEDALAANGPHIPHLQALDLHLRVTNRQPFQQRRPAARGGLCPCALHGRPRRSRSIPGVHGGNCCCVLVLVAVPREPV